MISKLIIQQKQTQYGLKIQKLIINPNKNKIKVDILILMILN